MTSGKSVVREAKEAFQTLLVMARDRLETLSNETLLAFVMETKIYNMIQTLKTWRMELETECVAVRKTRDDCCANFDDACSQLKWATRRLSDEEDDLIIVQSATPSFILY